MLSLLSSTPWFCAVMLSMAVLSLATPAHADVSAVNSHLTRAEANLEMVNGSIGHLTSPPKGSAGKLAKLRLDQAYADLEPAGKLLAGLSGEGVAEAAERYNTDIALYNKLAGILSGKAEPPAPKEEAPPKPAEAPPAAPDKPAAEKPKQPEAPAEPVAPAQPEKPTTVRLGYPHADNFKNTQFTFRNKVEPVANQMTQTHAELVAVEDQLSINFRTTAQALETITEAQRQAGFVKKGLDALPSNGEGVAEAYEQLNVANEQLAGAEAYFKPLHAELMALIDPANYPDYQTDLQKLKDLASMYARPDMQFMHQKDQAVTAYQQAETTKADVIQIARKYGRLMQQKSDQGVEIDRVGTGFLRNQEGFLAEAEKQKQVLPGEIKGHLAEADKDADAAVSEKKPLWFTGGIPQKMGWAEEKLVLLEGIDPAAGKPLRAEYDQLQASLAKRADSLKELIIQSNGLPSDSFHGDDRQKAIDTAIDAWKHQEKDFEVLTARIPSEAWEHIVKHHYDGSVNVNTGDVSGTVTTQDRSRIQVQLIIADKANPKLAKIIPVNIWKDHNKGDTMIGVPLYSGDEKLQPHSYLLREKVK